MKRWQHAQPPPPTTTAPKPRRQALLKAFREHADDVTAAAQQPYMKSTLPFFGLPKPLRAALTTPVFTAMPPLHHDDWLATAQHLWRTTTHREQWYATLQSSSTTTSSARSAVARR